ncbi:uncharacterized protein LOC112141313 [Oryzias melastigma]|uniref:uncharacterized protein LOC112141313 n=1 Tax=Oryzias melastigma TaxID=30732 RepID=UPI000CF7F85F|nr:uncharacterized protein LOC112141313 [Oryzias melastigma]
MPPLAVANNLQLADIPEDLCNLNILERHLIAKCIPFAKIVPLPKGRQHSIRGNVVCVPSEVQETVDTLPRIRSQSQVLRVKLKRRLCYKGHQLFQSVTWSKLMKALHKLKQIHPQYQDISIRDEPEVCDPTLVDEVSDDDQESAQPHVSQKTLCETNAFSNEQNVPETEHVNTDQTTNDTIETQAQVDNDEQEGDLPNGGLALESCLQPPNVAEDILSFTEGIYSVAPAERNSPVGFFKTPHLEAISFPVQFPTGQNTLDSQRPIKLTPSQYFKSRMFSVDDRFAKDINYLFFAQFVTEINLATSSMTIQLRKGKPFTRDGRRITSRMLRDKEEVEKLIKNRDAIRFMQPLRGTPAYWEKTTKDLFAMIRQLGNPTWFLTVSAAEMRWPEVIQAIKRQQGEEVNFEALNWTEKTDILRSNPVTTMRMFEKRVEALFRDLILSAAQILGRVIDFFFRVEYQNRGSPHIHCLLWVDGAPVFDKDDDQTVCSFISKYISAQLPNPTTQPELYKTVKEVQTHSRNHPKACFKYPGADCRFGFPKPPSDQTMITRPDENSEDSLEVEKAKAKLRPLNALLKEPESETLTFAQLLAKCSLTLTEYKRCLHLMKTSSTVILKRDPKDCWVNAYNPHVLQAFDSNMDLSFILNAYSVIMYLTSYITKQEHGLSEYLKTVIENSSSNSTNQADDMKEVMQAYSKKREISAQECVTRLCGLPMKKSSRGIVFVPTDDNAVKMSRPISQLEDMTSESEEVWMRSLADKYKCRPETTEFENMCMADFAATCRLVYGQERKAKGVLPLLNGMGFVKRRNKDKPAVIRFYRPSEKKNPEQFFQTQLKLYLPYRSEDDLKRPHLPTYQSFYHSGYVHLRGSEYAESVQAIVRQNQDKYEKNSKNVEQAIEEYEQNRDSIDEWCNLAPESELVRLQCVSELQRDEHIDENEQENVPEYSRQANSSTEIRAIREAPLIDHSAQRQMYQSLNQQQACVFFAVRDWCIKRVNGFNPQQFLYYVNGGAGTGKSHLIKSIHAQASNILRRSPRNAEEHDVSGPSVLLTSFTGTAAFQISGTTLHSLLRLPRILKPPIQGLGNLLDEVRAELLNAEIIIIDEVSMVSKVLFSYVDARLKQIKGSQKPFGGMSVLAVGDFYQLPPVRQSKPLCVPEQLQADLWNEHFQMVTLTEIMRQKDDVAFAEMLNRIRVKDKSEELSQEDRALLTQAVTQPALCPIDALHIFATNKQVNDHNSSTLSKLHANIIALPAHDYKKDLTTGRMTRQDQPMKGNSNDLLDTISVAEGARLMLTRNIDIRKGLVNGAFGELVSAIASDRDQHVMKLALKMDNSSRVNAEQPDNVVYLERVEENLKQKGMIRRQFPVKLAYACTIHKVQGMTTQKAVVSLKRVFESGMSYVAISRVTSLSGLHLLDFDESKIYANQEITAGLDKMKTMDFTQLMPLLHLQDHVDRSNTMTVVHHNSEGLPAHIGDIKSHHEFRLADILCLTETHLQGTSVGHSILLEGYNMFYRNRHQSYTNFPQLAKKGGGGVAVYVRDNIQVTEKRYLHNVTDLEFVALKVETPVSALIVAVYRPPDYNVTPFLRNLNSLLDSLEILDTHPIIICGDFNENALSDTNGPILQLLQTRKYAQLITNATTDKNTLLDLIFISQPERCLHSGVMKTYYSYHDPVYCIFS